MVKMSMQSGGLPEMRKYFDEDVHDQVAEAKRGSRAVVASFAERVRANTPVGPTHKREEAPYYVGMLRDSVESDVEDRGDEIEATVGVGGGSVDYEIYVQADLAREGKDLLRGQDDAEAAIDAVLRGEKLA